MALTHKMAGLCVDEEHKEEDCRETGVSERFGEGKLSTRRQEDIFLLHTKNYKPQYARAFAAYKNSAD